MSFNIEEFKSNGAKYGFLRSSYFLAAIARPPKFYNGKNTRFLTYLCSAVELPGMQIITSEERVRGQGPARKIPYDITKTDVSLTFYADGNGESLAFFDEWIRSIVSFGNPVDPYKGAMYGEVQYPDVYETNLELYVYNPASSTEILKYTLERAYPTGMTGIQMNWSDADQIATITVPFTFQTYRLEKNIASREGNIGNAVERNSGYWDLIRSDGFIAENSYALKRRDSAESITSGVIGIPGFNTALNTISSISNSISDKLAVVNNISADINSQIASYASFFPSSIQKKFPSIPTVSPIVFP